MQETSGPPRRLGRALLAAGAALLLHGCAPVGPNYRPPETPMPDAWFQAATDGIEEGQAPLQTWWAAFEDPVLDELIQRAQARNLDLKQAVAVVEEARAQLGVASGKKMPVVDVGAGVEGNELSDNGPLSVVAPPGGFDAHSLFEVGIDASWEIDVFGGIRRSIESASAELGASVERYRDVLVTLLADVALNYVDARTLQQRISYAQGNIEDQKRVLQLVRDRYETGVGSALDVAQARYNLANTQAAVPTLETRLYSTLNRVAVLLGERPGAVHEKLGSPGPVPSPPPQVAVGIPAELLRQRPDVRQAERSLAAQTAQVGVATAALYPRFSLSGVFALQARDITDLPKGSSITWNLGFPIQFNVFNRERLHSNIKVQEARTDQLFYQYEQTVLQALEEVENSLVAYVKEQARREYLAEAVKANKRALELVTDQYDNGLTDFQNVLDTQRSLVAQEDQLAISEGQVMAHLISLYKALGGGWSAASAPTPQTAAASKEPEASP
jgi:multidrug efflux system outer membrane protein